MRRWWLPVALALVAVSAWQYTETLHQVTEAPSESWSRATIIGESAYAVAPAGCALDQNFSLWAWSGSSGLEYAVVSSSGEVLARGGVPGPGSCQDIHVVRSQPGTMAIVWLDTGSRRAMVVNVDYSGRRSEPLAIGDGVDCLSVAGGTCVVLASDASLTAVDLAGTALGSIDLPGKIRSLDAVLDGDVLHMALYLDAGLPQVVYAQWSEAGHWSAIMNQVGVGSGIRALQVGLVGADPRVYTTLSERHDLEAGQTNFAIICSPEQIEEFGLKFHSGRLRGQVKCLGDLAVPSPENGRHVLGWAPAYDSLRKRPTEIFWLEIREPSEPMVQRVSRSAEVSVKPGGFIITEGDMMAAWLETAGFGRYAVCLAGTSRAMRSALSGAVPGDYLRAVEQSASALMSSLPMILMAGVWLVPCYLLLFLAMAVALDWVERHSAALLVSICLLHISLRAHLVSSGVYQPIIQAAMPAWLASPIGQWVVPLVIAGVAGYSVCLRSSQQAGEPVSAAVGDYTTFSLIDASLLVMVYGPYIIA